MKIPDVRIVLWVFSMLLLETGFSQNIINGIVKDNNGKGIPQANVLLKTLDDENIVSFGITDSRGQFSIEFPELNDKDSISLVISHLSYKSKELHLNKSLTFVEITMVEQQYELPELTIQPDPVTRRGDTLIFDVNSYREISDQTIEDVLRKIPGITVQNNGRILYRGLDISKFYIEGLDMLEGRYRIATRNLSVDAIRDIEVLEHHQWIKALDSLVRPDNAAINLKLKSNIALTGTLQGATGASPALYYGAADIFGFAKTQQFNIIGSANNIGINQGNSFQNIYIENLTDLELDIVRMTDILSPLLIPKKSYLDNREKIGGFNYLRKLSGETQLKWQGYAGKDKILNMGMRSLEYNDTEEEELFEEEISTSAQPTEWNNRFIYEHNAKNIFFRADGEADLAMIHSIADNIVNDESSHEILDKKNFNSSIKLSTIFRGGSKAYRIDSDMDYQTTDYDLTLIPVDIFAQDIPSIRLDEALQTVWQRRFRMKTYTNLYLKTKHINGTINAGISYKNTFLDTDMFDQRDTTGSHSLGLSFQNQNNISEFTPFFNQVYKKENINSYWTFSLDLSFPKFDLNNKLTDSISSFYILVIKPKLEFNFEFAQSSYLNVAYSYDRDYDRFNSLFHDGYIIRSNRNIATTIFDPNQYSRHGLRIRYSGINFEKNLDYYLMATLSITTFDFLNSISFNDLGLSSNQVEERNSVRRFALDGMISGTIWKNIEYKLSSTYTYSSRFSIINENELENKSHFLSLNPDIFITLSNSIVSLKPRWLLISNNIYKNNIHQFNLGVVYFLDLDEIGTLRLSYNHYLTDTGENKVWNELMNLEMKHSIEKHKIDIYLYLNNLTNSKYYTSLFQSTYFEELSYYRLRSSQVHLGVMKKF